MSRQPTPAAWGMSAGALVTRLARVAETITITSSITPSTCLGPPALACGSLARCSAHEARRSEDRASWPPRGHRGFGHTTVAAESALLPTDLLIHSYMGWLSARFLSFPA